MMQSAWRSNKKWWQVFQSPINKNFSTGSRSISGTTSAKGPPPPPAAGAAQMTSGYGSGVVGRNSGAPSAGAFGYQEDADTLHEMIQRSNNHVTEAQAEHCVVNSHNGTSFSPHGTIQPIRLHLSPSPPFTSLCSVSLALPPLTSMLPPSIHLHSPRLASIRVGPSRGSNRWSSGRGPRAEFSFGGEG